MMLDEAHSMDSNAVKFLSNSPFGVGQCASAEIRVGQFHGRHKW